MLAAGGMDDPKTGRRAAALMLQRLPDSKDAGWSGLEETDPEDDWRRAVALMSSVTTDELLSPSLTAETVLYRLFHEDGVRVFKRRPLRADCRCRREKVVRVLRSFPADDVAEMADDGTVTVTCEFCKKVHAVAVAELIDGDSPEVSAQG